MSRTVLLKSMTMLSARRGATLELADIGKWSQQGSIPSPPRIVSQNGFGRDPILSEHAHARARTGFTCCPYAHDKDPESAVILLTGEGDIPNGL